MKCDVATPSHNLRATIAHRFEGRAGSAKVIAPPVRCFAILGTMDERPKPPPWGLLISQALKRSGLSARKAASRAGLSEGRWRQITSGYQNVSAGVYAPVRGPADTLARMAQVVGVTPEQLDEADRPDAAEELRALELDAVRQAQGTRPDTPREVVDILASLPSDREEQIRELTRMLGELAEQNARNAANQTKIAEALQRLTRDPAPTNAHRPTGTDR